MQSTETEILNRDGFVVLKDILPPADVERARRDFAKMFERDIDARRERRVTDAYFEGGPAGVTILTKPSHLAVDVMGKSETFDLLVERMLEHPRVRGIVEAWSGPHFRIGSANVRYMTGEIDPPPAHELHRDGPYAMNLCILLSEVPPGDNGATAFVAGSHRLTVNPRWDCLFEKPFRLSKEPTRSGFEFFLNWNIFNRLFKAKIWKNYTGAFGAQGDVYFMANGEVWHGRVPNLHGRKTMICLIGCAATTPEYAAEPQSVSAEVVAKLPPRFKQAVGGPFVINDPSGSMIDRLWKSKKPVPFFSLERWAKLERRFAEWISAALLPSFHWVKSVFLNARTFMRRLASFLKRRLLGPSDTG